MHDRQLLDEEYDEETEPHQPDLDPINTGVGSTAYLERYTLDECVERFPDSTAARFPDVFDRFYFDAPTPVLIDILGDSTVEQLAEEKLRKHTAFKVDWCAEHDRVYVPLAESDVTPDKIRALIAATAVTPPEDPAPAAGQSRRPPVTVADIGSKRSARKRSGIERPKAVAA